MAASKLARTWLGSRFMVIYPDESEPGGLEPILRASRAALKPAAPLAAELSSRIKYQTPRQADGVVRKTNIAFYRDRLFTAPAEIPRTTYCRAT